MLDQDDEWAMKIYRVRGMVDRVREFVDQDEEWSRICRPGVEIVDRVREFVDQDGGTLDQDDEWAMKIYRVRGMVDQKLESSTGSETSSTGSEDSSTRTAGWGWVLRESGQSVGTPFFGSDLGSDRGMVSDIDTRNDRPSGRRDFRRKTFSATFPAIGFVAFFRVFSAVLGQKLMNRRGE
ncbi:maternal effect embryo arrest protein [Arabidopsis thaliana]|uniref:Maternal effect embryo arrest protein n=1 Tax=Arabidopsis thaliana TaxID=3702 RepID=F4IM67_ARATH|nr:maternal effect embryo arrest protein [Arabidopsis thaliana]AEC05388.1 maternal effect embryo arrest protein [Arabidopsis thaliana]|eukprot:NP_001189491.1 maternal effect embryo arrest protein [Arabidopsis thaliana]